MLRPGKEEKARFMQVLDGSHREAPNAECAALLMFNEALPLFTQRKSSRAELPRLERIYCLRWETTPTGGYATLKESDEFHDAVHAVCGAPARPWPETLNVDVHRQICRAVADRAWRMLHASPVANEPVMRMKINDRVLNRMEPAARIETLLRNAIHDWGLKRIITPWTADAYRTVERPGMLKLNSPGHRLAAMLQRLQEEFGLEIHSLWPERVRHERPKLFAAKAAMAGVRAVKLAGRAVRDKLRPFPAGRPSGNGDKPRLGFIVGGASPWYHTKPLFEASREEFEPVVIAHDIFRSPSAYRVLKESGTPFIPIDSQLPLTETFSKLASGVAKAKRLQRQLVVWGNREPSPDRNEAVEELRADLACLPELELYVDQLRAAIRRYDLKAVVSSNVLDSLLSAGGEACRAEGIPKICLQNTTAAFIDQPIYADCDVYFAESEAMADFMRQSGARGDVEAVGLPIYDELLGEAKQLGTGAIRNHFPELKGKRIISLIAAPKNHDYQPLLEPLLDLVMRRDDVGLIIRLHPRSHPTQYEELGRELKTLGKGGRMHHVSLAGFLADTDYMVATISSTTQSALVMGVRPFCWVPPEWQLYADEANQLRPEIENRWNDPGDVVSALENALDDELDDRRWRHNWRRFVARNMTGVDGRACDRILRRIRQLAA